MYEHAPSKAQESERSPDFIDCPPRVFQWKSNFLDTQECEEWSVVRNEKY